MAIMRGIAANRAMETTETQGTGAYALEGPVAGYTSFAGTIATGQLVGYCAQQILRDGNGDIIGADFEIGLGTLTHGAPDTLARTAVLESTNGDAAVNWGPGVKTIFATLPAQLVPMMAAALTSGQAGKALVVNAASRAFELGGPFVPAAGGEINGLLEIIRAGLPLGLRDTDNTDAVRSLLALARGTGGGDGVSVQAQGDEANGIELLRVAFAGGGAIDFLRDGGMIVGAVAADDFGVPTKKQLDTTVASGPHVAAGLSNLRVTVTGDTGVDVDVDFITVFDASGNGRGLRNVDLSLSLASTGANGRDGGSEAANTWYAVYVIYNPTTNTVAGLLSTSATSPTLPSGYIFFRRVGWVRNNASSNLVRTRQTGDVAAYVIGSALPEFPIIGSGAEGDVSTPTWAAKAVASYVPATAAWIELQAAITGGGNVLMAAPNNSYGAHSSTTATPPLVINSAGSSGNGYNRRGGFMLEGASIYYACSNANGRLLVCGWQDSL